MIEFTMVCVKFPPDDLAVLDALVSQERLKRSDIVRRAVRAYATKLSAEVDQGRKKPKRTKPK